MGERLRICHVSVLNPARHTRIWHKQALPAAAAGHRVTVLAATTPATIVRQNGILIWGHRKPGLRNWGQRIALHLVLLVRLLRLQPQVLHVHTPELLHLAALLKLCLRCKVIYDRHEDYPANLARGKAYSGAYWPLLARLIWVWEHVALAWIDYVTYAEASYAGSLPAPATVLDNKALPHPFPHNRPGLPPIRLLVTGTLASDWGIDAALAFYQHLSQQTPCTLTFAGHAPHKAVADQIHHWAAQDANITLLGIDAYVPHGQLLRLMSTHHLGLALYTCTPTIAAKVPTCFYEYMAAGLPFVFSDNPAWEALNANTHMGIALHSAKDSPYILQFLSAYIAPESAHWQYEGHSLLAIYDFLTK